MSEKGESPMEHVDEMRRHHGAQSMPTQTFLRIQLQRAERALEPGGATCLKSVARARVRLSRDTCAHHTTTLIHYTEAETETLLICLLICIYSAMSIL
jgi:hypothetical protein